MIGLSGPITNAEQAIIAKVMSLRNEFLAIPQRVQTDRAIVSAVQLAASRKNDTAAVTRANSIGTKLSGILGQWQSIASTFEQVAQWVRTHTGIGAATSVDGGLGSPVIGLALIASAGVAIAVAVTMFANLRSQENELDAVARGVLSPEEYERLRRGAASSGGLAAVSDITRYAVLGLLAVMAFKVYSSRGARTA